MKEFVSQTGGRYTYIDDIMNLQELSLAFANIFDGCDNFIISGCQVSGTTLSSGFVYLDGKIRYCAGLSGISKFPVYIYESNSIESVSYADSSEKVGRNVYGCAVATAVPTIKDTLTDALPQSISIGSDGTALRLKDAFFGKYALMTDSPYSAQSVAKDVEFKGNVTIDGISTTKKQYISNGTANAIISYDSSGNLTLQSSPTSNATYKVVIDKDGKFSFVKNGTTIAALGSDGVNLYVSMSVSAVVAGNIAISRNNIYNTGDASDTGVVNINMLSYGGNQGYYRDTYIGNGRGAAVLRIIGSTKSSLFNGAVSISNSDSYALVLQHSTLAKTDTALLHTMAWTDKNDEVMGYIGYINTANSHLYLHNDVGDVVIDNDVHITGKLYVNDKEFTYDGPTETKDTGWLTMTVQNCGITTELYVRQVGHVVSIQGRLHTHHSGTIFTLPNSIDPPKNEIGYSHNVSGIWRCVIHGGSRDCVVDYCNGGCSQYIEFLMTYLV